MVSEEGLCNDKAYRRNPSNVDEIKRHIKDAFTTLAGQNI
jgi:hypothetical protein